MAATGATHMPAFALVLLFLLAAPAAAQERAVAGRMICEVTDSRFAPAGPARWDRAMAAGRQFAPGTLFTFDYALTEGRGLTVSLAAADRRSPLIDEPFAGGDFTGISGFSKSAEYRAAYSELSLGRHGINYKGSDQLYLKNCGPEGWTGHFVQTHVSGLFTQVVSLDCHPVSDATGDVLDRLALLTN